MTVIDVQKDTDALEMTITAEFAAPATSVWQLWADPRKLEKWWGPPMFPATVEEHALTPGGSVTYFMTSPEDERFRGYWNIIAVDEPERLEFEDGFADADGNPDSTKPATIIRVSIVERGDGVTRMTSTTSFPSIEALEELLAMGMEEGMRLAMDQMDDLLV